MSLSWFACLSGKQRRGIIGDIMSCGQSQGEFAMAEILWCHDSVKTLNRIHFTKTQASCNCKLNVTLTDAAISASILPCD